MTSTYTSFNQWISHEDVIQTYCGLLFSCKKDEITTFEGKHAEPEENILSELTQIQKEECLVLALFLVAMSVHLSTWLTVSERNFCHCVYGQFLLSAEPFSCFVVILIFRPNKSSYFHLKLRISDGFDSPNLSFRFNCKANVCQVAFSHSHTFAEAFCNSVLLLGASFYNEPRRFYYSFNFPNWKTDTLGRLITCLSFHSYWVSKVKLAARRI